MLSHWVREDSGLDSSSVSSPSSPLLLVPKDKEVDF